MAPIPADDPFLQQALIAQESSGNPNAISYDKEGNPVAYGLTQITIPTWNTYARPEEDISNPDDQKKVGVRILSAYYDKVGGDTELGLAAYNAGPQRVADAQKAAGATSFEDIKSFLPPQTRDYVPRVLGRYQKLKDKQETIPESPEDTETPSAFQNSAAPEEPKNVTPFTGEEGTVDEFNYLIGQKANTPEFFSQPPEDQLAAIADTYRSKQWHDPNVDTQVKELSSLIWETAQPGELPSIGSIVGPPPIVEEGQDPAKVLEEWKINKIQDLRDRGVVPELFGEQLDSYMRYATDQESQAFTARNRGPVSWLMNRSGNYVRQGTKGVIGLATTPLAAVPRLAGAPFGLGQKTADYIESRPEVWLGQPANDFLYYTDKDGNPVENPDGTFKTHPQAAIAEGIGEIFGIVGTLGTAGVLGASTRALSAVGIGTNVLTMANSSFRDVYAKTGNIESAYGAAAFALPAGAIGSIGELGIISGAFRPSLKAFSLYEQARTLAHAAGKASFVNAAAGGVGDVVQQFGETLQTGEEYDPARTGEVAAIGAIGGGIAGGVFDLVGARKTLAKNNQLRYQYQTQSNAAIAAFIQGVPSQATVKIPSQYFTPGDKALYGVEATANPDGTTTLTKKTNGVSTNPVVAEDLPNIYEVIRSMYTGNEILNMGVENAELLVKGVRDEKDQARTDFLGATLAEATKPEYMNTLKNTEERLASALNLQPLAPMKHYSETLGKWEDISTGKTFEYAKDLFFPENIEPKFYKQDLSDISHVNIIDEAALPPIESTRQELTQHETNIADLSNQLLELKKQRTTLDEEVLPIQNSKEVKTLSNQADKIATQISQAERKLPKIKVEQKNILDLKKERTAINRKLLNEFDKGVKRGLEDRRKEVNVEIQEAQNKLANFTQQTEAIKKLKAKQTELENRLKTFPEQRQIQESRGKGRENSVKQSDIRNKIAELKLNSDKLRKTINERKALEKKIEATRKQNAFGEHKNGEIILTRAPNEAVRTEVRAHEIAHAIQDKVNLPAEAEKAINAALTKALDKGSVSPSKEVARDLLLPSVVAAIPEGAPGGRTPKAHFNEKGPFSKKEYIANQVAALILERNGKSIGDYKILPEVRKALEDVKLPSLETRVPTNETTTSVSETDALIPETTTFVSETSIPTEEESNRTINISEAAPEAPFSDFAGPVKRGERAEVALSKTLTDAVPGLKKVEYDRLNKLETAQAADAYVAEKGAANIKEQLSNPEIYAVDPRKRSALADALWRKAQADLDADPSAKNIQNVYEVEQLVAAGRNAAAQIMGLIEPFRATNSFGEFIAVLNQALRDMKQNPVNLSDLQTKELRDLYKKAHSYPQGNLRNIYVQKLFNETIGTQKISPGQFWSAYAKNAIQTNLLSGVGSNVVNLEGGAWLAPLFTALAHPFLGRGIVWRTMINTIKNGTSYANAKHVFEGKAAQAFYGGLYEPSGLNFRDYSSIPRYVASLQNKFGRGLYNTLGAVDSFMRITASEGYTAFKQYKEIQALYGNDAARVTSEVAKIMLPREQLLATKKIAEGEGKALGLNLTDADTSVRAFEILRSANTSPEIIKEAGEWANVVSLRGEFANPLQHQFRQLLYSPHIWNTHPYATSARNVIVPFGRAMLALSDVAMDFVPGNILLEKALRYGANKFEATQMDPRSPVLKERLLRGQIVGSTIAAAALGLSRSGFMIINGDEEQVLDRGGEGDSLGKRAKNRAQFKESQQMGEKPYSVVFPALGKNGFVYKDLPGLNAIFYGLYRMNKAIDSGSSVISATGIFFLQAFKNAAPFMGVGTLNSPYIKLVDTLMDPEVKELAVQKALENAMQSTIKMAIPASSLLRDVKNLYDSTPEETNQDFLVKAFANVPIISEISGSKPALNRLAQPIERTGLERTPFGRVIAEQKVPTDPTLYKLWEKGLVLPELPSSIKINKSDYASPSKQVAYEKTREDRAGSAYTKVLTSDEWYDFIVATGPYVKSAAIQVLSSNLSQEKAQMRLLDKVRAIEDRAMERYIRNGKFTLN